MTNEEHRAAQPELQLELQKQIAWLDERYTWLQNAMQGYLKSTKVSSDKGIYRSAIDGIRASRATFDKLTRAQCQLLTAFHVGTPIHETLDLCCRIEKFDAQFKELDKVQAYLR